MKRFLILLCLCLSLLCLLPSAAAAAEVNEPDTEESTLTVETQTEEHGFFFLLYERLCENLPEVFSALSFLSACILALCYKKGLLPLLRDGLGAIGNATKDWGKTVEKCAQEREDFCKNANDSIQFIQSFAKEIEASIQKIEQRMSAVSDQKGEGERLRLLMEGQVELLCDIFLSSSLPQFEKERVCKRVEEMKRVLRQKDSAQGGKGNATSE